MNDSHVLPKELADPPNDLEGGRLLLQLKHSHGFRCMRCGHTKFFEVRHRGCTWECSACRHQETARKGTILEASGTSIATWIRAVHTWLSVSGALSIKELQFQAGIPSYTTAWRLHRRINAKCKELDIDLTSRPIEVMLPLVLLERVEKPDKQASD